MKQFSLALALAMVTACAVKGTPQTVPSAEAGAVPQPRIAALDVPVPITVRAGMPFVMGWDCPPAVIVSDHVLRYDISFNGGVASVPPPFTDPCVFPVGPLAVGLYSFQVRACNEEGCSLPGEAAITVARPVPRTPTNPRLRPPSVPISAQQSSEIATAYAFIQCGPPLLTSPQLAQLAAIYTGPVPPTVLSVLDLMDTVAPILCERTH